MTEAFFYYRVPHDNLDSRNFWERLNKSDERKKTQNIHDLVSKLKKAEDKLSQDTSLKVYSGEFSFPCFSFHIESYNNLSYACERLFDITSPIFPFNVKSDKIGYTIINNLVSSKYNGRLGKNFMSSERRIVISGIDP